MVGGAKLSIIIPVLNEAQALPRALAHLKLQAPQAELVVVDGGSQDGSVAMARPFATVVESPRGRARQLNLGARQARGEWLLFLHADTWLPNDFASALAAAEAGVLEVGVFQLRIVGRHPLLPLLSLAANLRTRWRRIFLGDQAMFIRRELFLRLGGFAELPLLEDYAFALLLKRRGIRLYLSPLRVETSGRRWDTGGFFRTWWQFRRIFFRYHLSGDTERSAAEYNQIR